MSTTTLSQRLRDLRIGLFPDIETVNAVLDDCIAQAEAMEAQAGELSAEVLYEAFKDEPIPEGRSRAIGICFDTPTAEFVLRYARDHGYLKPSQTIGEQTPVAWMYPSGETRHPIHLTLEKDIAEEECRDRAAITPLYRSPTSPEARDNAIVALATVIELWRDELVNEGYDTSTNFDKATQAISALRGQ
jgi:hypothetical protein